MITQTKEETLIRQLLVENAQTIGQRDLDAHMAPYADDLLMFDAIPPLAFRGAEQLRKSWQMCLDHTKGDMQYEHLHLEVTVSGDMAYATSVIRFQATSSARDIEVKSCMRNTMVLRKLGGEWKIVHAHGSAPFDPMTAKALQSEEPVIS